MCSIMSHSRTKPASSRPEFVIMPFGVASEITLAVMSGGHCNRNTVVGHPKSLLMMMQPMPWLILQLVCGNVLDDSLIPIESFDRLILPHEGNCCGGSKQTADIVLRDGCTVKGVPAAWEGGKRVPQFCYH